MKRLHLGTMALAIMVGLSLQAQPTPPKGPKAPKAPPKVEEKEVIIKTDDDDDDDDDDKGKKVEKEIRVIKRNKGGKEEKMTIVVDGDNITINGKPAGNLKGKLHLEDDMFDGDIDVRVMPKVHGKTIMRGFEMPKGNKAMLGVSSEMESKGAKVKEVIEGSAAEKAGLKAGDIITAINGEKITEGNDLVRSIGKHKPDEQVDVTILRDGAEKQLKATLGKNDAPKAMTFNWDNDMIMPEMPEMPAMPRMEERSFKFLDGNEWNMGEYSSKPKFGFSIKDNEDGDGVRITDVKDESSAAKAGMKKDDLVTEVNGTAVKNTDALKKLLAEAREKNEVNLKVLRNGSTQTITMKVPKRIKTADL